MTLHLTGAGAFPHPTTARAVWVGLGGAVEAFAGLAMPEQVPHLTVARTGDRRALTPLVDEIAHYRGPSWTAVDLVLFESRMGAVTGPRYREIEALPLGDESDRWGVPG